MYTLFDPWKQAIHSLVRNLQATVLINIPRGTICTSEILVGIFLAEHEDQLSAQLVKFVFFDKLEVYIKDMLQEVWITFF